MVTNIHTIRINTKDLPKDLGKTLVKRAEAAADHAGVSYFRFTESPINEIVSLKNLGIKYQYKHTVCIQLSLF